MSLLYMSSISESSCFISPYQPVFTFQPHPSVWTSSSSRTTVLSHVLCVSLGSVHKFSGVAIVLERERGQKYKIHRASSWSRSKNSQKSSEQDKKGSGKSHRQVIHRRSNIYNRLGAVTSSEGLFWQKMEARRNKEPITNQGTILNLCFGFGPDCSSSVYFGKFHFIWTKLSINGKGKSIFIRRKWS